MVAIQKRLRAWLIHPDRLALFGLLGLLFVFYPELFLVKAAPLTGDHLEQHYPWAYLLAKSVREFRLPFWTPLIHCGFPLVAESQVGAFYIPNLLMYFFLPFQTAYSYMNLLHWFIAGLGTYLYSKKMKLGSMAAFVAAVIFTFGSAYGGAYYNTTSLKTICWFPIALYFLECYLGRGKRRFLLAIALVIGQSLVAGYMQMAAFTWGIYGVYVAIRVLAFPEHRNPWIKKASILGMLALATGLALLIALPQICLTFQLAIQSNRSGLSESYAYIGSMSPAAIATLVRPSLEVICRGNSLYGGLFALFLVVLSCSSQDIRKLPLFRIWSVMSVVALLLALGQWSPVYVLLIKLTKFYAFRYPAKFLGFICFGFSMLAAIGFQSLWEGKASQALIRKTVYAFWACVAIFVALMSGIYLLLTLGKSFILKIAEYAVAHFVYAKSGHPHTLEFYLDKAHKFLDTFIKHIAPNTSSDFLAIVTAILCMILLTAFFRSKIVPRFLLKVSIVFLIADLYAVSFWDMKLDFLPYKTVSSPSPVTQYLVGEKNAGRLGRIYGFRSETQRLPLSPSFNMLYDIADVGAYSPLVSSRYFQTIGLFGNVNDSNFSITPTPAFVLQRLPILSFLNVTHILSAEKLTHPDLKLILTDPETGAYLYALQRNTAPVYFVTQSKVEKNWESLKTDFLAEGFDPSKVLLIENANQKLPENLPPGVVNDSWNLRPAQKDANYLRWKLECASSGFFASSILSYPGWQITLNGTPVDPIDAFGLFLAVPIEKPGTYMIEMNYRPRWVLDRRRQTP